MAKKDKSFHDVTAVGAGLFGASAASAEAASSDALREGMALFLEKSGAGTPAAQLKGNLFEYIEAARFNEKAALQGGTTTALVTAADGRPQASSDIELINKKGEVVKKIQAKVSNSPKKIGDGLADPKYKNKDGLTTIDKAGPSREYSEQRAANLKAKGDPRAENYRKSADKIKGQIEHGGVRSGGTTTKELDFATRHPRLFAMQEELRVVGREAGKAGLQAGAAAALVGGTISSIRNFYAYAKGDIDGEKAAANITEDAVKSGARGGSSGAFGALIRHGADKAGLQTLAKSNVATAVAASVIEVGITVYDYAKGAIPAEQAAERIGNTGCSTLASIYTGAAAGAIFGPAGAVIGSIAGYMVTTSVYQSCIAILRDARLAEEEADRVVALCEQAITSLGQQQAHFEAMLSKHLNERRANFDRYFEAMDEALGAGQTDDAILALSSLVASFGRELQFAKFEDFDTDMAKASRSDPPLII